MAHDALRMQVEVLKRTVQSAQRRVDVAEKELKDKNAELSKRMIKHEVLRLRLERLEQEDNIVRHSLRNNKS